MTAACRSCRAAIVWKQTPAGKAMPLDLGAVEPERGADGAVGISGLQVLEGALRCRPATIADVAGRADLYRPHFATCPNADQHRRSTK